MGKAFWTSCNVACCGLLQTGKKPMTGMRLVQRFGTVFGAVILSNLLWVYINISR